MNVKISQMVDVQEFSPNVQHTISLKSILFVPYVSDGPG